MSATRWAPFLGLRSDEKGKQGHCSHGSQIQEERELINMSPNKGENDEKFCRNIEWGNQQGD